jgi:hypothetical protein
MDPTEPRSAQLEASTTCSLEVLAVKILASVASSSFNSATFWAGTVKELHNHESAGDAPGCRVGGYSQLKQRNAQKSR